VREDLGNPCLGIPPPRDGVSKRRHWLRPGEVLAVVSWPEVPREWREAIAIGCGLHTRPGELHELRIKDLDLASGDVRICRAFDERKRVVKTPKTDEGIRTVTIPTTLMPLLERIARDGKPEDRVAPIVAATEEYYRASLFRSFLKAAGVARSSTSRRRRT
jgi:integrase